MASGSGDGTVKLWESGRPQQTLYGQRSVVRSVAFSHIDGKVLTSGLENGIIVIQETSSGSLPHELRPEVHAFRETMLVSGGPICWLALLDGDHVVSSSFAGFVTV